jgi:hypothetical protein
VQIVLRGVAEAGGDGVRQCGGLGYGRYRHCWDLCVWTLGDARDVGLGGTICHSVVFLLRLRDTELHGDNEGT